MVPGNFYIMFAALASAAAPSPSAITLTNASFLVPKFFVKDGPFKVRDIHYITGVADVSGGTLNVKAPNSSYTIRLDNGTVGPWFNRSEHLSLSFKNFSVTGLSFLNHPLWGSAELHYDLAAVGLTGKRLSNFEFFFMEPGFPAENVGNCSANSSTP